MKKILSACVLLATVWMGCASDDKSDEPSKSSTVHQVRVVSAQASTRANEVSIPGQVSARNRAEIAARVQARVEKLNVGIGSIVSRGDLIAVLDSRDLTAQLQQAESINDQVALEYSRYQSLIESGAVTKQEVDAVTARKGVAEANHSLAKAMLSYAAITSPFDGVVTERLTDVGDMASPGRTLFVIEQSDRIYFDVSIPERLRNKIAIGDTVMVSLGGAGGTLWGTVAELSPNADPVSRSQKLRVLLPQGNDVRPGQYGQLILSQSDNATFMIPSQAVHLRGQLELVYVVGDGNRASLRLIRSGKSTGNMVEVLSGISESDQIIIEAPNSLTEGDSIEIHP
jgi:RND family efflux transporter MFP subunit